MILELCGITYGFGARVVPSDWKVVQPKWRLCPDCCVTLAKWLPLSDPDFLHALTWAARNIGSSNSEHSVLFPPCSPFCINPGAVSFYLPFSFVFSFSSCLLTPFSFFFFLVFLTWLVMWKQCQPSPWEIAPVCLLGGERRGRRFFCCEAHVRSAGCVSGCLVVSVFSRWSLHVVAVLRPLDPS